MPRKKLPGAYPGIQITAQDITIPLRNATTCRRVRECYYRRTMSALTIAA
jgi:hypothetical protein